MFEQLNSVNLEAAMKIPKNNIWLNLIIEKQELKYQKSNQ